MPRIGYAPGAFDLFHVGHLNLLRQARSHCDFLIDGVASDEILGEHKGVSPVVPLAERLAIVGSIRAVDRAYPAVTADKLVIWRELQFDVLFKGDDWRGTEKGDRLERAFAAVGVEVIYFPYTLATSSTALRRTLRNIDAMAERGTPTAHASLPHALPAVADRIEQVNRWGVMFVISGSPRRHRSGIPFETTCCDRWP